MSQTMKLSKITFGERYRDDYGDLDGLAASINKYGLLTALTVSSDGKLLAGGRRYKAACLAGLETVPVRVIDTFDGRDRETLELEIELEENTNRKDLVWQEEIALKDAINEKLKKINPRHTQKETAQRFAETPANMSRDLELAKAMEAFPELKQCENKFQAARKYRKMKEDGKWLLKRAEQKVIPKQWRWAENHYQIGDAIEGIRNVTRESIHFIEADPPYGLTKDQVRSKNATSLELYSEDDLELHSLLCQETFKVAAKNSWMILWHAISQYTQLHKAIATSEWIVDPVPALWLKPSATGNLNPDLKLAPRYETFTVLRKGIPKLVTPRHNVFEHSRVDPSQRIRHAEKPIELYSELLDLFVQPAMKIMCPFLGSGNFLLACYDKGYTAFGWELDPDLKPQFLERVKRRYL